MIDREFDEMTRIHLMMRVVAVSAKTESDRNIDMAPSFSRQAFALLQT